MVATRGIGPDQSGGFGCSYQTFGNGRFGKIQNAVIKHGGQENPKACDPQHTTEHRLPQGPSHFGPGSFGNNQGQNTQNKGKGGH